MTNATAQVIDPVACFDEKSLRRDLADVWAPHKLAHAFYAPALAEPARRQRLLPRAVALLRGLPPRLPKVHDVRQWWRVAQARHAH